MRILVTGSGRLGVSLLLPLLQSRHEVIGVILDGRKVTRWQRVLNPRIGRWVGGRSSLSGQAHKYGLPIYWLNKMNEEDLAPIRAVEPDIILVGGFGIIFKEPLLALPRIGCVNTHSSLLPRHRGPNPFFAVLMEGEPESGVTFHVMTPGIDEGDLLHQAAFPITEKDTLYSVYQKSCDLSGEHVVAVMDQVENKGLVGTPQDPNAGSYDKRPTVNDVWFDWEKPAADLERLVRAVAPSPMPRFLFKGSLVYVAKAEFTEEEVDFRPGTVLALRPHLRIATGRGALILRTAFANHPIPWVWPAPWSRPKVGERLG